MGETKKQDNVISMLSGFTGEVSSFYLSYPSFVGWTCRRHTRA